MKSYYVLIFVENWQEDTVYKTWPAYLNLSIDSITANI